MAAPLQSRKPSGTTVDGLNTRSPIEYPEDPPTPLTALTRFQH